jgi:hypothetical protein
LTRRYALPKKEPKPRKKRIPETLRSFYAPALAQIQELREQGMTWEEVCDELTRLGFRTRTGQSYRHPQQPIKIVRSFS